MYSRNQIILSCLIFFTTVCLIVFYQKERLPFAIPVISISNILNPTARSEFSTVIYDEEEYYNGSEFSGLTVIKRQGTEYNLTEVITNSTNFVHRVLEYNFAVNQIRNEIIASRKYDDWRGPTPGTSVNVVWGANDDFLEQLGKYPEVQTVSLPWLGDRSSNWSSLTDKSNLLLQNYYEWTASDLLCKWVETPGTIKMKYDVTFNRTCSRYMNNSVIPQSLKHVFLHMKPVFRNLYWPNNGKIFPSYFYQNTTPFVFYMHVVTDVIVTDLGDIYSSRLKIVPYSCSDARDPKVPLDAKKRPLYDEVFVIAQYWGTAVFHRMSEIVPRLAGWLPFLKQNPRILIFAKEGPGGRLGEILSILGLDPRRLVTEWGRAKIAYVPRVSYCGMPSVQESQIVASIYHKHVENILGPLTRNKLLLIRRSGSRRFTEQLAIEEVLKRLAEEFGLEFKMFIDNPTPSLGDTMRMFHSAVMVVAPHGAGLANLYFSQPGTYVVEGVCNLPHVNFCFQRLSVILGHHWHGIPSRGGCEGVVDVAAKDIENAARVYLQFYKAMKN